LPSNLTSIGSQTFYGVNAKIEVPYSSATAVALSYRRVPFMMGDFSVYYRASSATAMPTQAYIARWYGEGDHVLLPELIGTAEVTQLLNDAFKNCPDVRSVWMPDSISFISTGAFTGCSEELVIRSSATAYARTWAQENGYTWEHDIHTAIVIPGVEPTCTENGTYDSVVYCSVCDVELSREVITIDATGHTAGNAVEENRIAPTCTENGTYDSVVYCLVCNDELSRETITIDATGHDAANSVEENRVNPTCTEDGSYDSVVYCSVCNEELSRETITLNKLGHDIITHEAQSPTCTQVGWDAYDTCSRCDYTTYKEIHPLGHNPTVTKEENRVEATCITDGSYDSVVYCSVCNEELSRENKTIKAPGHNLIHHDAKDATCTEIGWNAYETCRICDYTTYVEISALGHKYGTPTIVEPEYKKDGYTTHTCSVCNHEEKYDITPALTYILGDADGNETIDSDDAIYLLFHTLLPEEYAVNQKCDFDGDGDLDSDDAIYLLYHTLLLEKYPLHK